MAPTVGLIKELLFISNYFKRDLNVTFHLARELDIKISNGILHVKYSNIDIWCENLVGAASMFGLESADSISRIIYAIDNNLDYLKYCFFEKI